MSPLFIACRHNVFITLRLLYSIHHISQEAQTCHR